MFGELMGTEEEMSAGGGGLIGYQTVEEDRKPRFERVAAVEEGAS